MRSKKFFKLALMLVLTIGLTFTIFADPGVAKLNIWVSDVANACGTWQNNDQEMSMTILDCNGILQWNCGRYLAPNGIWQPVPNTKYWQLPFICGHLEVEVPPGYYWVVAGQRIDPGDKSIRFNYTTHVGIVQVRCGETACVKLYNPSIKLCWEWFRHGLRMHTIERSKAPLDPEKVKEIEMLVEELLRDTPSFPAEKHIENIFEELYQSAKKQQKQQK